MTPEQKREIEKSGAEAEESVNRLKAMAERYNRGEVDTWEDVKPYSILAKAKLKKHKELILATFKIVKEGHHGKP